MALVEIVYFTAGVLLAASALLAVIRIVRGPSILDRLIGSDVLLTAFVLVIGAEMVINDHTRTIPIMVVLAATAVFSTIAVARYVSKQDALAPPEAPDSTTLGGAS
ncbi:MAG: monovalent cation/H+ antiporter complex subunit F [Microbacteriaceae bacterium]